MPSESHVLELEKACLGAIFLEPTSMHDVVSLLSPNVFSEKRHGQIFQALLNIYEDGDDISFLTVRDALRSNKRIKDAYLIEIQDAAGSTRNAATLAKLVFEKYIVREVESTIRSVSAKAEEGNTDPFELLGEMESKTLELSSRLNRKQTQTLEDLADEALKDLEFALEHKRPLADVSTGFKNLDKFLGGWQKQDLVVIAARPSMGKTLLALCLARNAARQGVPNAIFSLEMSGKQLVLRLVALESKVDTHRARRGDISHAAFDRAKNGIITIREYPIHIDDTSSLAPLEFRSKVRQFVLEHKVQLVFVDYLQLMDGTRNKSYNREQEVAYVSRSLKAVAKECDITVVAMAQLSRANMSRADKRPGLTDLRECFPTDQWIDTPSGPQMIGRKPTSVLSTDDVTTRDYDAVFVPKRYNSVYRLVTKSGDLRATARHLVLTGTGWKQMNQINPDRDVIAVPKKLKSPSMIYLPHGRLLGWLLGNGHLSGTPSLTYRREIHDDVVREVQMFGVDVNIRSNQKSDNVYEAYLSIPENGCKENPLMRWLRDLGLEGRTSHDKFVPWEYRLGNDKTRREVLQGLWESDGTVTKGRAKYCTASETMARQVKWLLHTVGIRSSLSQEGGHLWVVRVLFENNPNMQNICSNRERFGELGVPASKYVDPSPSIFVELIDELNITDRRLQRRQDGRLKRISKEEMSTIMETTPVSTIIESPYMKMNHVAWEPVQSIEKLDGEVRVCDMVVPGPHNLVAGGIVAHNSGQIEQDADVIMFIHRPEYYGDKELEDGRTSKGVAELIIGKQRNGPIGTAYFKYNPKHQSFTPLSKDHGRFKLDDTGDGFGVVPPEENPNLRKKKRRKKKRRKQMPPRKTYKKKSTD